MEKLPWWPVFHKTVHIFHSDCGKNKKKMWITFGVGDILLKNRCSYTKYSAWKAKKEPANAIFHRITMGKSAYCRFFLINSENYFYPIPIFSVLTDINIRYLYRRLYFLSLQISIPSIFTDIQSLYPRLAGSGGEELPHISQLSSGFRSEIPGNGNLNGYIQITFYRRVL